MRLFGWFFKHCASPRRPKFFFALHSFNFLKFTVPFHLSSYCFVEELHFGKCADFSIWNVHHLAPWGNDVEKRSESLDVPGRIFCKHFEKKQIFFIYRGLVCTNHRKSPRIETDISRIMNSTLGCHKNGAGINGLAKISLHRELTDRLYLTARCNPIKPCISN